MREQLKDFQGWLIIIYRVPSLPSTSRVTIWKRIKELGGFLLQQSVYIFPNLPALRETFNVLKEQIQHLGGECKILEIASLDEGQEKEVIAGFNSNREEEYTEVVKACRELLQEIDEESKTEDFHFADLEENEKHLQRVRELLENVTKRDYFQADSRHKAAAMFSECVEKFGAFSQEVYLRAGIVSEEKKSPGVSDSTARESQQQVYSRKELLTKLREITRGLDRGTLEVSGKRVSPLSAQVVTEWNYRENRDKNSFELKITWANSASEIKEKKRQQPVG